jgi:hypothetical protein
MIRMTDDAAMIRTKTVIRDAIDESAGDSGDSQIEAEFWNGETTEH